MEDKTENYYSLSEIIRSARSFTKYLFKRWWLLALFAVIGCVLAFISYKKQKPSYKATTTFILEEKNSGSGGLSSLASQFGFNVGSISGGGIFSGDNILNILRSKKIIQEVLLSRVDTGSSSQTLADLYLDFSGSKNKWLQIPSLSQVNFSKAQEKMSPLQDSVLFLIYDNVIKDNLFTERSSKQSSIIKVQVTAKNAVFARLMSERLVQEASKLYLDIRVGTMEDNIKQLQRRSDSLLYLLNSKSYYAAASQPLDFNPGLRTATVPVEIANRDKTVLSTLYAEVIKNLEMSKLMLSQETPVIQLLDTPELLLNDNKKSFAWFALLYSIGFCLVYVIGAFAVFVLRSNKAL